MKGVMKMTVFKFRIFHLEKGCIADINEKQLRYVLADTEEEAVKKLDKYRKEMISKGFADFILFGCPTVETENVII
jgi:hypothetical protein